MGIATTPVPPIFSDKPNSANSMSQDYHHHHHQGIFSFSNGFERSAQQQQQQQQQQHIAQQIRRDKLRVQQGYEPPLVGIEEEESGEYESAGMLSEMFNFPPGAAAELLEQQQIPQQNYRQRPQPPPAASNMDWSSSYGNSSRHGMVAATVGGLGPLDITAGSKNHNINAESAAAAMQLFLMNPQPARSPSPPPPATSSTLHMLLPNPSSHSLQGFHQPPQFTWVPDSAASQLNKFGEIGGVVEGQGLSLSLSSSLQHLEAAKAEELRMGDGMLFFNQGGAGAGQSSSSSSSHQYPYKNLQQHHQKIHLQGGISMGGQNHHQVHVGFGSSLGVVNIMRNSRYVKAAQELLEEFCSVGRVQFKKNKFGARHNSNTNPNSNPSASAGGGGGGGGGSSSSSKDLPSLSAADRIEHQRRKVKLLSMLDEACTLPLSFSLSLLLSLRAMSHKS